jgi:hypothetical protein
MSEKSAPAIFGLDMPESDIFNPQFQTGRATTLAILVQARIFWTANASFILTCSY